MKYGNNIVGGSLSFKFLDFSVLCSQMYCCICRYFSYCFSMKRGMVLILCVERSFLPGKLSLLRNKKWNGTEVWAIR